MMTSVLFNTEWKKFCGLEYGWRFKLEEEIQPAL